MPFRYGTANLSLELSALSAQRSRGPSWQQNQPLDLLQDPVRTVDTTTVFELMFAYVGGANAQPGSMLES